MFRRKQDDEDPFAALKDAAERGSTRVTSGNAEASASTGHSDGESGGTVSSSQVTGVPGSSPRRRSNAFLVLLTIVVSLGAAAALLLFSKSDMPGGESGSALVGDGPPAVSSDEPGATTKGKPPAPKRYDLLQPAALRRALGGVQRKLKSGERITNFRLARDRINIGTKLRDGRQRLIDVDRQLKVGAMVAGSAGASDGMNLAVIDPQAPARAVRTAARKGRFSTRKLDYLVMTAPFSGEQPDWSLFFTGVAPRNTHWIATRDGRSAYRPGEQPTSSSGSTSNSVTIRTDRGTTTLTGDQAQRVMTCVRRAGSDGAKIQACLP